jgi:beta-aspartyl-peptidase (threonine type)
MILYGVVTHGGAGSSSLLSDGCKKACEAAYNLLENGRSSLDAVVEAARILEDDGRFNAGSGSSLRLDGKTIEMDAAVMDSKGNLGIAIAVRDVKNPILVARNIVGTPHVALAGEGATIFARKQNLEPFHKISDDSLKRYEKIKRLIKENRLSEDMPNWKGHDIKTLWNFKDVSFEEIFCDTIGAVAIDREGVLAAANSTGGFSPMLKGRVGDGPMIGCGFYAGTHCAIAATGMGEEIIKRMLAKTVYDMVSRGEEIRKACENGIRMFPHEIKVGIIAISKEFYATTSNSEMACSALIKNI